MTMTQTIKTEPEASVTTWSEFEASSAYRDLTVKQRAWVIAVLATDDPVLATRLSYNCKSVRNATILSWEIRNVLAIKKALRAYHGKPADQVFLDGLQETIDRAEPGSCAQVDAQKLYAQLVYAIGARDKVKAKPEADKPAEPPKPQFKVGDIATLEGERYRVTAIRDDGTVSEADPL